MPTESLIEFPSCLYCGGRLRYCARGAEVSMNLGNEYLECDGCSLVIEDKDARAHRTPDRSLDEAAMLKQALKACEGLEDLEDCLRETIAIVKEHFKGSTQG